MNLQIKTTEVHERRHEVAMTADQVREILIDAAIRAAGVTGAVECVAEFGAPVEFTLTEMVGFALPPVVKDCLTADVQKPGEATRANPAPVATTPAPAKAKGSLQKAQTSPAPMSKAAAWTAEEDELIVSRRAGDLRDLSISAASRALAEVLPHRTEGAIYFRMQSKLAARIEAAMDAADLAKLDAHTATERAVERPLASVATSDRPESQRSPEGAQSANSEPVARLPLWQVEIGQRLDALGYANDWSAVEDLELVELLCTGWKLGDVAARLDREIAAARERWQLLVVATVGHFRSMTTDEQKQLATTLKARKG